MGNPGAVIRAMLVVAALLAPFWFTAGYTFAFALLLGVFVPLVPFALGILVDTLYWGSDVSIVPWYSFAGAVASVVLYTVRRFFAARLMRV